MESKKKVFLAALLICAGTLVAFLFLTNQLGSGGTGFWSRGYKGFRLEWGKEDERNTASLNGSFPSLSHESLRRKAETASSGWHYLISGQVKQMKDDKTNKETVKKLAEELLTRSASYHYSLRTVLEKMRSADGKTAWRERETRRLAQIVQSRIRKLQNPANCTAARKMILQIDFRNPNSTFGRGLVSHMHLITQCLLYAYHMDRTLVLRSKGWEYDPRGWDGMFMPLSDTCPEAPGRGWQGHKYDQSAVEALTLYMDYPRMIELHLPLSPYSVPRDLVGDLARVHGDPSAWWVGQFVTYVMRPRPQLSHALAERMKKLTSFQHPIVGLQVRRGWDKNHPKGDHIAPKPLSLYMEQAAQYFSWLQSKGPAPLKRRIFIATDSPDVIKEAREKHGREYEIVNDAASTASAVDPSRRETLDNLVSTVLDLQLLAQTDLLVCTCTSNLCRAAYELMQARPGDWADRLVPVDLLWLMWLYPRKWRAVEAEVQSGWLPMEVGDELELDWAPYREGVVTARSLRLGKSGSVALHKIVHADPPFDDTKVQRDGP